MYYLDFLRLAHELLEPPTYLEGRLTQGRAPADSVAGHPGSGTQALARVAVGDAELGQR